MSTPSLAVMQCVQELNETFPYWIHDKDSGSKVVAEIISRHTQADRDQLQAQVGALKTALEDYVNAEDWNAHLEEQAIAALASLDQSTPAAGSLLEECAMLKAALHNIVTGKDGDKAHRAVAVAREALNKATALAQPAPAAPDSAKDGARLNAVFAHGFIRWIAEGPYKGKLLINREMLDTAISTTP